VAIDAQEIGGVLSALQQHVHGGQGKALPGHAFVGAIFLFAGSLLVAELLAGPVSRRHRAMTLVWPAALFGSGIGMLLVTLLQPTEKPLHLTLAVLLLMVSYFEAQYRQGYISRQAADTFQIPALIVGGFVIGPMHANGPMLDSAITQAHLLVGVVSWTLAAVKLAQLGASASATVPLSLRVGLDYSFGFGVMALGFSLLLVQQFHGAH